MTSRAAEELEQLRIELAEARARAEEASAVKRTFLRNMSHELRTPLNAIIGYSEILLEETDTLGESADIFATDLEKIRGSGRNLLSLVDDLLDMAKIEAGDKELYYEEVPVEELLRDVARSVRDAVESGGNRLTVSVDPDLSTILTDRTKVRQVLLELLGNASMFTRNGAIEISANLTDGEGEACVSIVVADQGVGIAPEELEGIFDAFSQVDGSSTREHGGSGIGLTLSRQFCRQLRGDLTVASRVGEGTEFTVTLPVVGPATRIEEMTQMGVLDLWASVEAEVHAATSLEEAAQALADGLHAALAESTALVRVFVTAELAGLPAEYQKCVALLAGASGAEGGLHDATPVLSLIGTAGLEERWNDRRLSVSHLGVPLISEEFISEVPMVSSLLKEVGVPLDWAEDKRTDVIQRTIGRSAGLFFVENAALATDNEGRKIIPAQEFVNDYGIESVFAVGGAYSGDEILVVVVFCTEQCSKAVAERFLPLVTLFKRETSGLVAEGRVFAE